MLCFMCEQMFSNFVKFLLLLYGGMMKNLMIYFNVRAQTLDLETK